MPSRDRLKEFGKWASVYWPFLRWTLAGLWEGIIDALIHGLSDRSDTPVPKLRQIVRQNDVAHSVMPVSGTALVAAVSIALLGAPPDLFSEG